MNAAYYDLCSNFPFLYFTILRFYRYDFGQCGTNGLFARNNLFWLGIPVLAAKTQ